jgi:hypothetical protein
MTQGLTVPELEPVPSPITGTDEMVFYRAPGPLRRAAASAVQSFFIAGTEAAAAAAAADAIATAADRVQTGLDVVATAADRVQTGLDAAAAAASEATTTAAVVALSPWAPSVTVTGTERVRFKRLQMANVAMTEVLFVRNAARTAAPGLFTTIARNMSGVATILSLGTGTGGTGTYNVTAGTNCGSTTLTINGGTFTGSITAGVLTVTAVTSGTIIVGATITGSGIYKDVAAVGASGSTLSITGLSGVNTFTLFALNSSGIVGTIDVDVGTTTWTAPASNVSTDSRLDLNKTVVGTTAWVSEFGSRQTAAAAFAPGALKPFADGVTVSDNLRLRVRDLKVFDIFPGHTYSLATFIIDTNGLKKRLRIEVRDNDLGLVMCSESRSSIDNATVAEFVATLPEWITLTDVLVSSGNKRRTLAHIQLDLSAVTDTFSNLGSSSVLIHPDNVLTKDQQGDFLANDSATELVTCGASGADETTFDDAQTATYSLNWGSTNINGQPVSDLAAYDRRARIFLTDEATYTFTSTKLANFVEIEGQGRNTILSCAAPATAGAMEFHGTGKIRNVTITTAANNKYALHMDDVNRSVTANGQFTFQRKVLEGVTLINPAGSTVQVLGGGISSGEQWLLRGVSAINLNAAAAAAAIGIHNSGVRASVAGSLASPYAASVRIEGCDSPNLLGLELYSIAAGPVNTAVLVDNSFRVVRNGCNIADADSPDVARERYVWNIQGRYDGPVLFSDDGGQPVLATTAGQTPSGTAAALIFGTTDELGRGDLWIKTGTTKSLGARLGDCSSVSKALTIGAQTHTFTTDLTAVANSTIITAINGSLTTYPVSEVDIQTEYVAPCQPQARMTNSTGATIPKGRFVKRTGASTVALAGVGDTIYGWTYREILNGLTGIVVTTRQIHQTQIEGASSSTGTWGLAANGLLDYGAATKIGSTMGSIVEF